MLMSALNSSRLLLPLPLPPLRLAPLVWPLPGLATTTPALPPLPQPPLLLLLQLPGLPQPLLPPQLLLLPQPSLPPLLGLVPPLPQLPWPSTLWTTLVSFTLLLSPTFMT